MACIMQVLLFVATMMTSLRSELLDLAGVVSVEAGITKARSHAHVLAVHLIDQATALMCQTKIEKVP